MLGAYYMLEIAKISRDIAMHVYMKFPILWR